jgi:hypothetical protein
MSSIKESKLTPFLFYRNLKTIQQSTSPQSN